MPTRFRQLLIAAYLVALHAALVVLVLKTDFLANARKTLGLVPQRAEWSHIEAEVLVGQLRRDPTVAAGSVLLFGDSIMSGVDATAVGPTAVNFGIGGDTTMILSARLPLYHAVGQSGTVALGVGVNDLKYRPIPEAIENYGAILDSLADRPRVIAVSVLPLDETAAVVRDRRDLRNAAIRTFNDALRLACAARANCRYLDVWPEMFDPASQGLRAAYHLGDGWHLSAAGGVAMGRVIGAAVLAP